jgi:hypothetical protein
VIKITPYRRAAILSVGLNDMNPLCLYCVAGKHLLEQCPLLKQDLLNPSADANSLRKLIKNLKLNVVYENPDNVMNDKQWRELGR